MQCMTAETKLDLLRQRLKGNKDGGADLRRREQEFLSLVEIQVGFPSLLCVLHRTRIAGVLWPASALHVE